MGQKYEQENEDDLKDKMDFVKFMEAAPGLGMWGVQSISMWGSSLDNRVVWVLDFGQAWPGY